MGAGNNPLSMQTNDRIIQQCVRESTFDFIRAAGPGGQNVNKVATAVQMRFDLRATTVIPQEAKARLTHLAGSRMTNEGVLVIEARRFRTQEKNRDDAIARFTAFLKKSLEKPKARLKTKPNRASREKRLESKKKRGDVKRTRQTKSFD